MLRIRYEQTVQIADDLTILGISASFLELNTQSSGTNIL
jgi:hypothetical protein